MAYLHLPAQHSTGDLVLAGQIAEAFDSHDLFVTWTHAEGAGASPTVDAIVRDAPPQPVLHALRGLLAALAGAWRAIVGVPAAAPREAARRERQTV